MLDQVRPALLPTAEVRKRSDGTEGIYDADLLYEPPESLQRVGMMDRNSFIDVLAPRALWRGRALWPMPLRVIELLFWPVLAVLVQLKFPARSLAAIDVPLFYVGCALAL